MATTWNPSDKAASITLSGSNLIATGSGAANANVRAANYGGASALLYCEAVYSTSGINNGNAVGFANASFTISGGDSSAVPDAITAWTDGNVYMNNGVTPVGAWMAGSPSVTDVISIAIDSTNKKFWARRNSGNWNNSGTANPATSTGGYGITNAGPYTAVASPNDSTGGAFTLRVAALSIPSGFTDMMGSGFPNSFAPRLLILGAG